MELYMLWPLGHSMPTTAMWQMMLFLSKNLGFPQLERQEMWFFLLSHPPPPYSSLLILVLEEGDNKRYFGMWLPRVRDQLSFTWEPCFRGGDHNSVGHPCQPSSLYENLVWAGWEQTPWMRHSIPNCFQKPWWIFVNISYIFWATPR
jgi:hypothetical protein